MSPPRLDTLRLNRSTPLKPANGSANRLHGPWQQDVNPSQTAGRPGRALAVSGRKLGSLRQGAPGKSGDCTTQGHWGHSKPVSALAVY